MIVGGRDSAATYLSQSLGLTAYGIRRCHHILKVHDWPIILLEDVEDGLACRIARSKSLSSPACFGSDDWVSRVGWRLPISVYFDTCVTMMMTTTTDMIDQRRENGPRRQVELDSRFTTYCVRFISNHHFWGDCPYRNNSSAYSEYIPSALHQRFIRDHLIDKWLDAWEEISSAPLW